MNADLIDEKPSLGTLSSNESSAISAQNLALAAENKVQHMHMKTLEPKDQSSKHDLTDGKKQIFTMITPLLIPSFINTSPSSIYENYKYQPNHSSEITPCKIKKSCSETRRSNAWTQSAIGFLAIDS